MFRLAGLGSCVDYINAKISGVQSLLTLVAKSGDFGLRYPSHKNMALNALDCFLQLGFDLPCHLAQ